ncbi:DNA repair protein UVH3 isoform X2 [Cryptomeria japonica]|uniref:DNA repair protein UVH3 isoform X2 n=1 Tax=Cryptomeria japonica TaxID=3369 RepID=UPI0027D9DA0E|nr:DNA repair protein UVH3 isoform X2 [Cryptomeria japonica]
MGIIISRWQARIRRNPSRKKTGNASIWMVQFMKAMRDDKGEMIRNAHLIGFFRRICKLLFLRVKPVFVFDGGTPALKRRTVIARRRQRERAQAKIRKTAEKLLLNHLRTRKLEELAQEIQNAKEVRKPSTNKNEVHGDIDLKLEAACSSQTLNDSGSYEATDALLAASLAAEDDGQLETLVSESHEAIHNDESEDTDGNEEMILPVNQGKIDPAVLAVLPPSMQLDLLVQMREQIMADNRKKFQKVKKVPASFSEMQIQAYLKTVAFRREIEEVQKSASGRGIGGMPTSRIASESGREFIFSSSFTGDKQALHFPGSNTNEMEERPTEQEKPSDVSRVSSSNLTSSMLSCKSVLQDEVSNEDSDAPVQTYVDEKGNIRVSRLRAMGVRMTRDLQWNLYLMKESEEQALKNAANSDKNMDGNRTLQEQETFFVDDCKKNDKVENVDIVHARSGNDSFSSACTSGKTSDGLHQCSEVGSPKALQISFTEDDISELGNEDDIFAALVAGESVHDIHGQNDACKHSEDDTSECEWEEGEIRANTDGKVQFQAADSNINQVLESVPVDYPVIDGNNEVEWDIGNNSVGLETNSPGNRTKSRKFLSEEEEVQEAIRRSLADFGAQKSKPTCSQLVIRDISQESCDKAAQAKDYLLGAITYKEEVKDYSEVERERKGKTLFTTEVDQYFENCNSKLKGYIEKNSQIPTEKYETDTNLIMKGKISSEICSRVNSVSTPAHEFLSKDPHVFTLNNCQPSDRVEKSSSPSELNVLNEIHENEQLCQTGNREMKNDNRMNELESSEPVQNGETKAAQNMTSMPEPLNDFSDKIISVNDAHDLYQDKVPSEPPGAFSVDDLIREAEETNSSRDREAALKKEAQLHEMKEENLRRKKEIEAELEVEKEALQASVDEEMVFLRQEELDLQSAQKKHERNAESVTGEMFAECQELLQMFGIPYIIAPMEAEAQCAYLECTHLVDGVVTDDCDVFLFGAGSVYKNIFDERKYVETYFMKDIEEELGLNREKLICMALLLGSDYTEGISGIGIVNAIEVVRTFHEEDGLKKFKEWVDSPDPSLLDKVHAHSGKGSRKKASKTNKKNENEVEEKEESYKQDDGAQSVKEDELSEEKDLALKKIFMAKHQAVSKNWQIPDSFPNDSVISAYRVPQVDKSTEPFSWGRPDLMSLRKLCWERFGWNKEKADELLLPVLKEYDRRETQLRLEAFYSFNERFAKIRSRRIQKAVTGITGRRSADLMDLPPHLESTPQKRPRKKKVNDIRTDHNIAEENMVDVTNNTIRSDVQNSGSAGNGNEVSKKAADSTVKLSTPGRGRGKGKGRGGKRGAGKGHGRGRKVRNSTDDSDNENEKEISENGQLKRKFCADKVGLRKSTRPRKAVKYALDEQESNCTGHSNNDSDSDCEISCEASEPKVLQKPSQDSPSSFMRKGEQTSLENNLKQTGFEIPDVGSRNEKQYSDHPASGGVFCVEDLDTNNDKADDNANCTEDYIAVGGGFCVEKDNQEDDLHTNNDSVGDNANSAGDCLATGGGFCVEEDNLEDDIYTINDDANGNVNLTRVGTQFNTPDCPLIGLRNDLPSKHAILDCQTSEARNHSITHTTTSDFNKGINVNSHTEASPNETDGVTEKKQETHSSAAVTGLRAMPFLRRRKRT